MLSNPNHIDHLPLWRVCVVWPYLFFQVCLTRLFFSCPSWSGHTDLFHSLILEIVYSTGKHLQRCKHKVALRVLANFHSFFKEALLLLLKGSYPWPWRRLIPLFMCFHNIPYLSFVVVITTQVLRLIIGYQCVSYWCLSILLDFKLHEDRDHDCFVHLLFPGCRTRCDK